MLVLLLVAVRLLGISTATELVPGLVPVPEELVAVVGFTRFDMIFFTGSFALGACKVVSLTLTLSLTPFVVVVVVMEPFPSTLPSFLPCCFASPMPPPLLLLPPPLLLLLLLLLRGFGADVDRLVAVTGSTEPFDERTAVLV